ncbi:MAG: NAD(P)H-hydrate dehydratase [Erysipelotrichaceae bacterium]|nr:NAD(P)H-hydrate dehydratase [Erysipelotrichaceae bacterium]
METNLKDEKSNSSIHPQIASFENMRLLWKARPKQSHKGTFGKVLLVGGSMRMQGALNMAAKACFQSGCGTLTLFTPLESARAIAAKNDLTMIIASPQDEEGYFAQDASLYLDHLENYQLIGCGNGMGTKESCLPILEKIFASNALVVLDADGINVLAKNKETLLEQIDKRTKPVIITPHLMEFSRLSGIDLVKIQADPTAIVHHFCLEHPNIIVVLKSETTLISQYARKDYLICRPDSALAKGGSGDVLCGIICGLAAWIKDPFHAAILGAFVHNQAAATATTPVSFTPLDLIQNLSLVYTKLDQLISSPSYK